MSNDTLYLNNKVNKEHTFDAIVIGSGISGGWAAKELTQKGLKVLMLERGPKYEHIKDYKTAGKAPYEFKYRGKTTFQQQKDYPVVHRSWAAQEQVMDAWANEVDCPYTEIKPFTWWRSYRLGGRSTLWGRQSYRWCEEDFEANAKDGYGIDWPIRYKDLEPWYDYVEKFAGIAGSKQGLSVLPDGQFLPPFELNIAEKYVSEQIKKSYNNSRHLFIGRVANLSAPLENRVQCQFRNRCWEGCPFGAYFSTQSSTLPAAAATGNLKIRTDAIVTKIIYDKDSKKAKGVELLDTTDNKTYEYFSKIIFVCASTLNSTWILMNSATDIWPDGLGSSSGELGHNIMDHHYNLGAVGYLEMFLDKYEYGRRPTGFYIPRFANYGSDKREFLRGYGYQGSASRHSWQKDVAEISIGMDLRNAITELGPWKIGATGFGEVLPYHENKVMIDKRYYDKDGNVVTDKAKGKQKTDKWGLPILAMDAELKENEMKMREAIKNDLKEMFEKAGVKEVTTYDNGHALGHGIHEMGTARMGKDSKTSVLNSFNQVWDAKNVFVTDGSCMTSSSCVNPSLTYMAMTARAADFAVNELKKQNL